MPLKWTRLGAIFSFLMAAGLASPALAVWPMPQYSSYPNCGSVTPAENCSQQVGPIDMHWQTKLSDRTVQYPTTFSCTPVSGQFGGFCDGPGCTSFGGYCRQPAILGTPTAVVETAASGTFVRFHLEYDFPGNYWPAFTGRRHRRMADRLQ